MKRVSPAIRESVRQRANNCCEYCLVPKLPNGESFHVDHIIPVKPHKGTESLENYAWACFDCNTTKAGNISSYDVLTKELIPLYNPRTQIWDQHFAKDGPVIIGKTAIGRVTVDVLEMNESAQIEFRLLLIELGLW